MGIYSYSGSPQFVDVTTSGVYKITACGAAGGVGIAAGGKGAEIGGYFSLSAGERLDVVVGGAGKPGGNYKGSGGGGGGTFILGKPAGGSGYSVLLVAGGGGGGGYGFGVGAGKAGGLSSVARVPAGQQEPVI